MFTYRELEIATDGFSEANVIGSNGIGGHGLMYRGVLSDGTMAAIKLLHTEGKQGERAFRIAVSDSASFNDLLIISSSFLVRKRFNYFLLLLAPSLSMSPFLVLDPVCSETLFLSFGKLKLVLVAYENL